jgi:hypothetical protein
VPVTGLPTFSVRMLCPDPGTVNETGENPARAQAGKRRVPYR